MRFRHAALVGSIVIAAATSGGVLGACSAFSSDDGPATADGSADTPIVTPPGDGATDAEASGGEGGPPPAPGFVLAKGMMGLLGIAATDTVAYFIENGPGKVHAVEVAGTGTVVDLFQGAISPSCIAVVGTKLVWGDYGKNLLTFMDLPNGSPTQLPRANGPTAIVSIGGDDYLLVSRDGSGVGTLEALTVQVTPVGLSLSGLMNPAGAAANSKGVYWTESGTGTIGTAARDADSGASLATLEKNCTSIAADDYGVYWTLPGDGKVRIAKDSAMNAATSLSENENGPFSVAVDNSGVYWLTADGKVRRKDPRAELPPETIAHGFAASFKDDPQVRALALTSKYVVWITSDGQVLRHEK